MTLSKTQFHQADLSLMSIHALNLSTANAIDNIKQHTATYTNLDLLTYLMEKFYKKNSILSLTTTTIFKINCITKDHPIDSHHLDQLSQLSDRKINTILDIIQKSNESLDFTKTIQTQTIQPVNELSDIEKNIQMAVKTMATILNQPQSDIEPIFIMNWLSRWLSDIYQDHLLLIDEFEIRLNRYQAHIQDTHQKELINLFQTTINTKFNVFYLKSDIENTHLNIKQQHQVVQYIINLI